MAKVFKAVLAITLLIGIMVLIACSGTNDSQNINSAPDFELDNLNGTTTALSSFAGKAVFINFWATTCPPCVAEMPHFQALYEDWSGSNEVIILTINIGESLSTVKSFMKSNNYSFLVLLDSQAKVAEQYRIQYTPTSILVGKDRQVKFRVIGAFKDKAAIIKTIDGALSEP